jgi:DNA-binding MurR/RpiR family transcriptional regulator
MSSRISQLNIIDILYTAYANSEYDYAMAELKKTHIKKEHQDEKD